MNSRELSRILELSHFDEVGEVAEARGALITALGVHPNIGDSLAALASLGHLNTDQVRVKYLDVQVGQR